MNAADVLALALEDLGVTHAFGMPGGEVLAILEALRARGIEIVLVRDEASAGFMADAVWWLTGKPALAVVTLGPGVTNLVTGLAHARLDRIPMIAVTGQAEASKQTIYTHQTLDQLALLRPVCKHVVSLSAEEAWREIPLALRHLFHGRGGPVVLNFPGEVATAPQPRRFQDGARAATEPTASAFARAAASIRAARRPVALVGLGGHRAELAQPVRRMADSLSVPVLTTYRAKGVVEEGRGWSAGALGLSPPVDRIQQDLLGGADLLVLVGFDAVELRPSWLPGWRPDLPVVVVDETAPQDLLHPFQDVLVGDIVDNLTTLLLQVPEGASTWTLAEVASHRARWQAIFHESTFGPATAVRALQSSTPPDAIVTLDVGAHRITAAHVWEAMAPCRVLQSNGLCSMGYALPAAIAARLVHPDRPVLCITGDMGLQMVLGELGVVLDHGLQLVVVFFSDDSLSLIELKQERMKVGRTGVRFRNPEPGALAAAFGGVGVRVSSADALREATVAAWARPGLTLIEARLDPEPYRAQM